MRPNPRPSSESTGVVNAYGRYATLGIQFVASMCVLGFAGYWVDGKLGTSPWLLILGLFLGAAGGFYSLLLAVPSATKPPPRDDSSR